MGKSMDMSTEQYQDLFHNIWLFHNNQIWVMANSEIGEYYLDIDNYISMLNDFSNASWDLLHVENPLVDAYDFKLINTRGIYFVWI